MTKSFYIRAAVVGLIPLLLSMQPAGREELIIGDSNASLNDTANVRVRAGWNLISVPVIALDMRASILFPRATSHPFSYDMGYNPEDTLRPGVGYWLKFAATETVKVVGQPFASDSLALRKGWNLIGGMSLAIAVNQINTTPSGIFISKFFGYNSDTGEYVISGTLEAAKGYWVKASQSGMMRRYCWAPADQAPLSPPDGYKSLATPTLTWRRSACASTYRLQIGSDSSLASIIIDSLLTDTSFHLSLFCSPTPNFWRVGIGSPALGMTVWSKVWHFQWAYEDSALVLPDDHGGTTLTPKFKWRRTSCTSSYEYQLATDSLFAQMVFDSTLSDTAYQRGSLDSAQTYFWRVGITLPSASKLWTQPRKFTAAWKYLGLNGELIQDIDIDWSNRNIVYVGSGSDFSSGQTGNIFKSTNMGFTWDTLLKHVSAFDIVIHPTNANMVYATLAINFLTVPGILKSTDGGGSWSHSDSGITFTSEYGPRELLIDPMHPETLYVNVGGFGREDSYKSTDGGHFWSRPSPQQISIGFIDPNNTNLLYGSYIGLSENYKSTDGGNSWISLTGTSDLRVIDAYDPRPPTRLYAGSDSVRINISTDGGTSWFASTNGLPQNDARGAGVVAMNPSSPDELLAATFRSSTAHADYFRTTDQGQSWKFFPQPFWPGGVFYQYSADGINLYAGVADYGAAARGLFKHLL